MPYAQNATDKSRVYYEDDGGQGAPVVMLGGFLDPIDLVRDAPIAKSLHGLSREFRLIFVDHRGHGRSDTPHDVSAYAMSLRVADVIAVLDALDIGRAHHVGISWGGRLVFGLQERAPDRTRSLVVIGQQPYAIDPDGPLARVVGQALAATPEKGIEALIDAFEAIAGRYPDRVRATYLAADAAAMRAAWSSAIAEGPVSENLGAWNVPCLICVAADDRDFFDQARRAADEIPNAIFISIERQDHLGMDTAQIDPVLPAVLQTMRRAV